MNSIDYPALNNAVQEVIDENLLNNYDFEAILRTAKIVWDNTAVQVTNNDFIMTFDLVSYELLDYTGNDIN